MTRKVFYSFHFDNDNWRAGQVRNIGTVEGDKPVNGNKWEDVKNKSDSTTNAALAAIVGVGLGLLLLWAISDDEEPKKKRRS